MRTENALRDALAQLAAAADLPAAAPVTGRPRRHRAAWIVAVTAVLVVAVAAVVLAAVRTRATSSEPPLQPSPTAVVTSGTPSPTNDPATLSAFSPLRAVFSLDPAAGFTLAGRHNTPTVQSGYVLLPDRPKAEIDVEVHAPGTFDTTSATTGTPVTVQGAAGWRGPVTDPASGLTFPSFVWPYAPGGWVVVADRSGLTTGGATEDEQRAVAEAVRISDPPAALPVPFRLTWLPADLAVASLQTTTAGDLSGYVDFAGGARLGVGVDAASTAPDGAADLDVDGHRAWLMPGPTGILTDTSPPPPRLLVVDYDGVFCTFSTSGFPGERLDDATLVRIAAGARPVTAVADPASWIPAAEAVPR